MKKDTLLIVDDMEVNRAILRNLFEGEYHLLEAENGDQALMLARQYTGRLAAVLLDLVMPGKSGYQVMAELSQHGLMADVPIVVITSEDSSENEVRAFDLGAADIIIKPFEPHVVRRRVHNAVELNRHKVHLEEMVEEQAAKLRESRDVIMDTLSSVIEHRSAETGQHVLRIRMFTRILLEEVMRSYPDYDLTPRTIGIIAEAAALHDIGKIAIPDTILNKPGPLSVEEFEVMKTHALKGCEILAGLDRMGDQEYLAYAYNICRYHHERWDGRGYPDGLKGDNTPICAQAVGIADAYDALTTDRVYKKAIPPQHALNMILNGECGAFSPKLLECLKNVREPFFQMTRDHADGHLPAPAAGVLPPFSFREIKGESVPETGRLKYLALLRYLNATVLEVDMDSGVYHLIHRQNDDFEDLLSGGTFAEAFRGFAEKAVHPEDRAKVLNILEEGIEDFFGSGLIQRSRRYRVLHRASGEYVRYEGSALRVDVEDPNRHRLLMIWKTAQDLGGQPQPLAPKGAAILQGLSISMQQCLNDRWFTMTYFNDGFLKLFGYTRAEIADRFQNRYIELVHPEDQLPLRDRFLAGLASASAQELEYRVLTKDGRTLWLLERCQRVTGEDGREYFNCVLTDITQIKQDQEQLRLSIERYEIIQNQTNDILFESDLSTGRVEYSPNWEKKFGYRPLSGDLRGQIKTASHLFPQDIPAFVKLMEDAAAGVPYGEAEGRIAKADGQYLWCRVRMTTQFDDRGRPMKTVGVILDIDNEKRRTQELTAKAERDALTRLYNKNTARDKIEQMLEGRDQHDRFAMLIIDLDNFKEINDSYGHMFGDAVLSEAAAGLKALFRDADVVAGFGGDEFLVFFRHASDQVFLQRKAQKVVDTFRSVYQDELPGESCHLTCSVGLSCCPEDGGDFQTLFQKCDQALYQAKQLGKDRFCFYETAADQRFSGPVRPASAAGTLIESEEAPFYADNIVSRSFQLLYESENIETAVQAILEMAGQRYNVSRVYIFENSRDGSWCANTFEWCAEGIKPAIDTLRHVSYDSLGQNYLDNFDENGIFYCRDVSELTGPQRALLQGQGIRSVLQCAVRDRARFAGFVGFDDCRILRMWTKDQINALTFIARVLSTFLLKKRAQDRAEASAQDLQMLLDAQNAFLYVIDPDTYELRYINQKTRQLVARAEGGMRCHEVFFHRDTPCQRCPAKGVRSCGPQSMEIYNPILDIWTSANSSLIRWEGQEACLLACHDITNIKRERSKGQGAGSLASESMP